MQLLELAIVTDKYDLAEAISPAYQVWRGDPKTMGVAPGVPATGRIFISWVFGDREWFKAATRHTLLCVGLDEHGRLEYGEVLEDLMPPVPPRVIGESPYPLRTGGLRCDIACLQGSKAMR